MKKHTLQNDFGSIALTDEQINSFDHELVYLRRAFKSIRLAAVVSASSDKHELFIRNVHQVLVKYTNLKLTDMQKLISAAIKHNVPSKIDFDSYRPAVAHNKGKKKVAKKKEAPIAKVNKQEVKPVNDLKAAHKNV